MKRFFTQPVYFASALILTAAASRLIPHPFNFTAIGAMAIFSGANFRDKRYAVALPLVAMLLTDLIIGFHHSMIPVYVSFAIAVGLGMSVRNHQNFFSVTAVSLLSSTLFFLITNLPVWYTDISLYPVSWAGTMESYTMALPFFGNQILGDLFYTGLLFGVFRVLQTRAVKVA